MMACSKASRSSVLASPRVRTVCRFGEFGNEECIKSLLENNCIPRSKVGICLGCWGASSACVRPLQSVSFSRVASFETSLETSAECVQSAALQWPPQRGSSRGGNTRVQVLKGVRLPLFYLYPNVCSRGFPLVCSEPCRRSIEKCTPRHETCPSPPGKLRQKLTHTKPQPTRRPP